LKRWASVDPAETDALCALTQRSRSVAIDRKRRKELDERELTPRWAERSKALLLKMFFSPSGRNFTSWQWPLYRQEMKVLMATPFFHLHRAD
jgi:hypothetical protein